MSIFPIRAQLWPAAAQFMQAMNSSMERMDRQMESAPMNGDVDLDQQSEIDAMQLWLEKTGLSNSKNEK